MQAASISSYPLLATSVHKSYHDGKKVARKDLSRHSPSPFTSQYNERRTPYWYVGGGPNRNGSPLQLRGQVRPRLRDYDARLQALSTPDRCSMLVVWILGIVRCVFNRNPD